LITVASDCNPGSLVEPKTKPLVNELRLPAVLNLMLGVLMQSQGNGIPTKSKASSLIINPALKCF
jgi:hypothetical protein